MGRKLHEKGGVCVRGGAVLFLYVRKSSLIPSKKASTKNNNVLMCQVLHFMESGHDAAQRPTTIT